MEKNSRSPGRGKTRETRAILINSFRLMQIRDPWLAYVLVRQLCFIVADEDVRHAQV